MTLAIGHFLYLNCLHCASSSPIMNYDCNRHNYHFHHIVFIFLIAVLVCSWLWTMCWVGSEIGF